ncbi:MAG: hypothetical protein PHC91_08905, partial [Eubacteriales bacterium]|nr:hypothetical protein [Eubacteriales bacterium]
MKKRLIVLMIGFGVLLLILTARLTQVQLLESEKYASVSAKQQRITLNGEDARGTIFDRNGNHLTGADESYIYILERGALDATA